MERGAEKREINREVTCLSSGTTMEKDKGGELDGEGGLRKSVLMGKIFNQSSEWDDLMKGEKLEEE